MTLDFQRLAQQLDGLAASLRERAEEGRGRLARALDALHGWADRPEELQNRLKQANTRWLLAEPLDERLDAALTAPSVPAGYAVLASDGSHIDLERHSPTPCFVLNMGWACIQYGDRPSADLGSEPTLEHEDHRLTLTSQNDASQEDRLSGNLLAALRSVREAETLARLVHESDPTLPTIALLDGTLVLWGLAQADIRGEVRRLLLDDGIIKALDELKALAEQRPLAVASYISRPNHSEVVHTLRLAVCPLPEGDRPHPVDCTRCPREPDGPRPCDAVGVGSDRQLFQALLRPGERSALFRRRHPKGGSIEEQYYGDHRVAFFYLRMPEGVSDEVARVEMPAWVAQDEAKVSLLHALLLDQCQRGFGYPLALTEAHEQAVITGPEREAFHRLLEEQVAAQGLPAATSAKAFSKRARLL
jgi:hypothetical protein